MEGWDSVGDWQARSLIQLIVDVHLLHPLPTAAYAQPQQNAAETSACADASRPSTKRQKVVPAPAWEGRGPRWFEHMTAQVRRKAWPLLRADSMAHLNASTCSSCRVQRLHR